MTKTHESMALEKGMPSNIEAEQMLLGSILLDGSKFETVAVAISADDFAIEKHRRIFQRMADLHSRGDLIEPVAVWNELEAAGQLESVDGLAYVSSLTDGMPLLKNIESYIRIVAEKALSRNLVYAGQSIISEALEEAEPPQYTLENAEAAIMKLGERTLRRSDAVSLGRIIQDIPGGLQSFIDPSRRGGGIKTPFHRFDEMTTGLHGGELIILAARPAMGKTAFAMDVSLHVARSAPVALFSLEMSRESLLARAMCSTARVCLHRFRGGYLDQDERRRLAQAWEFCKTLKLVIDDKATTTMMEIAAKCRKVKHDHGLSLVVIDYMQLIGSKGKVENRVQEISAFSRSLKLLAKDLDVPVICLSQLNRSCETRPGDRRPLLSDLRDSGSIEQDADLVAFLFREEVYKPDREDLHGIAELIVAKQRNGPTGKIRLTFLNKFTKFDNLADIGETSGPVEEEPAPNEPEQRTWYH